LFSERRLIPKKCPGHNSCTREQSAEVFVYRAVVRQLLKRRDWPAGDSGFEPSQGEDGFLFPTSPGPVEGFSEPRNQSMLGVTYSLRTRVEMYRLGLSIFFNCKSITHATLPRCVLQIMVFNLGQAYPRAFEDTLGVRGNTLH
jgi:hypothetical protein